MSDRLTKLYERYGPIIYARCVRLLADRAAAEDATQETFMRVHRHLDKAPIEALGWIYRIATNYCLNELRDRRHRPESTEPELLEAHALGEPGTLLESQDLVARIIRRTAPKVRVVAWLVHVDGLDQAEVARVLGISRRSVVNHLARAQVRRKDGVVTHPSQLQLDALHLGADDPATRAHLADCTWCRERVRIAELDHRYFLSSVMPRQAIGRSRQTWWLAVSAFAVVAALVVMFVRVPKEEPVLGIKGGPSVQTYASQGGHVVALRDGMALRPGDRIRFVVLAAAGQHVVITSIDGAGHATVFYDGLPDAARYEVPGSVILDDTLGPERIYLRAGAEPRRQILWFQKVAR